MRQLTAVRVFRISRRIGLLSRRDGLLLYNDVLHVTVT